MNYNDILVDYINNCPFNEPIFIEEIKDYFKSIIDKKDDFLKVIKSVYVYINRLVKKNILYQFTKGIYYKPTEGVFGKKRLNAYKIINKKYIEKNKKIIGYVSGAYLYNKLGLTTLIPAKILIVTNECPNRNDYVNEKLGVIIRKPKIEIDNDNYLYLQLFDLILNKDNINVEIDNKKDIFYKFIRDNNLEFEKIMKYAHLTNNLKAICMLYSLED